MELEIVRPKSKFFEEVNLYESFLWLGNLYIKITETGALRMDNRILYSFCERDEVIPCEIQKIIVKMC